VRYEHTHHAAAAADKAYTALAADEEDGTRLTLYVATVHGDAIRRLGEADV